MVGLRGDAAQMFPVPPPPRESLQRGGGNPPPPQHPGPDSTPKAFPYPNISPNRIPNRQ